MVLSSFNPPLPGTVTHRLRTIGLGQPRPLWSSETHPKPLVTEQPRREEGEVDAEGNFLVILTTSRGNLSGPKNRSHSGVSGTGADCWPR